MSSSQPKLEHAANLSSEPLEGKDAKWIGLRSIKYRAPNGQVRTWESAERSTRPADSDIDSVGAVAILSKPSGPEILLQRQYRPPVGKICIEVPSGLIDAGETAEQAAVRELREETGYVGTVIQHPGDASLDTKGARGVMWADPGMSSANTVLVHVNIDMEREENKEPKTELEESEFIETFTVKLDDFYREMRRLEAEGFAIDARVSTLAEGFELRRKFFS